MESNWVTKKLATNRCKRMKTLCMCCFNYLKHQPQNCMSCGLWQMAGPKPLSQLKMFQWSWLEHFVDLKALNFFSRQSKGVPKNIRGSWFRNPIPNHLADFWTINSIGYLAEIHSLKSRTGTGTTTWTMASQDSDTWFGISPYALIYKSWKGHLEGE